MNSIVCTSRCILFAALFLAIMPAAWGQTEASPEGTARLYRLDWESQPYIDHYIVIIQRQAASDGESAEWAEAARIETAENYADVRLEDGFYHFSVAAINLLGLSGESSPWRSFSVPAFTAPPPQPEREPGGPAWFALSLAPEVNMASDDKTGQPLGFGGRIGFEAGISDGLSVGAASTVSYNARNLVLIDGSLSLRWYPLGRGALRLFLAAETGLSALYMRGKPVVWTGLGAFSVGLRVSLGRLFVEPYIRAGYPFMLGAGVAVGVASGKGS
jgi:hypothetical protein